MIWGPREIAMTAAGAAFAIIGVWLLLFFRPRWRTREAAPDQRLSEPTRITLAVLCVFAGYHLILWTQPLSVNPVQLSRRLWYVWIMIGIAFLGLTLFLDRFERGRGERGD